MRPLTPLQSAWAGWGESADITHFITLTFSEEVHCPFSADRSLRRFHRALSDAVHGGRSTRRLTFFAVRERHDSEAWHFHILVGAHKVKSEKFREMVRKCWMESGRHHGDPHVQDKGRKRWFQRIAPDAIKEEKQRYVCKAISENGAEVNLDTLYPKWKCPSAPPKQVVPPSETECPLEWAERTRAEEIPLPKPAKAKPVQPLLTERQQEEQRNWLESYLEF